MADTGQHHRLVTVTVDGIGAVPVTVTEHGDGRPFLLLHGGAGPQSVDGFADLLATPSRPGCSCRPHPGFGGTPAPGGPGQHAGTGPASTPGCSTNSG